MKQFYIILTIILFLIPKISNCQENEIENNLNDTIVYLNIDISPIFIQGQGNSSDERIENFINQNLEWPNTEIDVVGIVFIVGIVEKDGSLTNLEFIRRLYPLFDNEAMKVVSKMKQWKPAIKDNYVVRSRVSFTIKFQLY